MARPPLHGHCTNGKLSPEYYSWRSMIQRCSNPTHVHYHRYGGRGIKVCKRWRVFTNFFADMGKRPAGTTLERRKNWLGYSLANCYWATDIEQHSNTCTTKLHTAFGETKTRAAWARDPRCVVKEVTFKWRMKNGWDIEQALTTPPLIAR